MNPQNERITDETVFADGARHYRVVKRMANGKVKVQLFQTVFQKTGFPDLVVPATDESKARILTYRPVSELERRGLVPQIEGLWRSGDDVFYIV